MRSATIYSLVLILTLITSGCSKQDEAAQTPQTAAPKAASSAQTADFVFTNGKVYTVNEKPPWAEAIAVKDNKIVYVGDAKGVAEFVSKDTEQFDLDGKMLLPGFVSGHDHRSQSFYNSTSHAPFPISVRFRLTILTQPRQSRAKTWQ